MVPFPNHAWFPNHRCRFGRKPQPQGELQEAAARYRLPPARALKPSHRNPEQVGILHTALSHLVHHTSGIDKAQAIICHNDMWPLTFHMCFSPTLATYKLLRFFFQRALLPHFAAEGHGFFFILARLQMCKVQWALGARIAGAAAVGGEMM